MNITVYLSSKSDLSDNFTNAVSAIGKGIGEMNARLIYGAATLDRCTSSQPLPNSTAQRSLV